LEVAAFYAAAYPSSLADNAVCAAGTFFMGTAREMQSADHLDALILATHPAYCRAFLRPEDQRRLDTAVAGAPTELSYGVDQSIRWLECRDYLEQQGYAKVDRPAKGQPMTALPAIRAAMDTVPAGIVEVCGLALRALRRVHELRPKAAKRSEVQHRVIDVLDRAHAEYQLV
jgi:hypothetical protein